MAPATAATTSCFHHVPVSLLQELIQDGQALANIQDHEMLQKSRHVFHVLSECSKKWSTPFLPVNGNGTIMLLLCCAGFSLPAPAVVGNAQGSEILLDLRDIDLTILITVQTVEQK